MQSYGIKNAKRGSGCLSVELVRQPEVDFLGAAGRRSLQQNVVAADRLALVFLYKTELAGMCTAAGKLISAAQAGAVGRIYGCGNSCFGGRFTLRTPLRDARRSHKLQFDKTRLLMRKLRAKLPSLGQEPDQE